MKCSYLIVMTVALVCASVVRAENNSIVRTVIERHDIPGSGDELQMILIEYAPGATGPPHVHPVVGLNYIIEGTAESQYEGEAMKNFKTGDSYQDPANKKHLFFRNASKTRPLKFLVACKIPKGETFAKKLSE